MERLVVGFRVIHEGQSSIDGQLLENRRLIKVKQHIDTWRNFDIFSFNRQYTRVPRGRVTPRDLHIANFKFLNGCLDAVDYAPPSSDFQDVAVFSAFAVDHVMKLPDLGLVVDDVVTM